MCKDFVSLDNGKVTNVKGKFKKGCYTICLDCCEIVKHCNNKEHKTIAILKLKKQCVGRGEGRPKARTADCGSANEGSIPFLHTKIKQKGKVKTLSCGRCCGKGTIATDELTKWYDCPVCQGEKVLKPGHRYYKTWGMKDES